MTTHTDPISYDVVVVGAGPSGLATAIAATRAGARVLVVERHQSTSTFPKATGVRPRTMEILRSWGLEEQVLVGGTDLRLAAAVSATLADRQQQDFSLGMPQPETLAGLSPSAAAISPQDHLEPVLLSHVRSLARSLGGAVRFQTDLVGLDQHDGGVSVRVRAADGAESSIETRYLVGADGAGSTVRRAAGIEERQLGSEGDHLAVLFHAAVEERIRGHRYGLHIVTTPESGRVRALGHTGPVGLRPRVVRGARRRKASPPSRTTRPRSGWPPACRTSNQRSSASSAGRSRPRSPSGCGRDGSSSSETPRTGRRRAGRPA